MAYQNLRLSLREWSRMSFLIGLLLVTGCGDRVHLIREGPSQGVALYFYNEGPGHLRSSNRELAFQEIKKICSGGYRVIQEGKARGRHQELEGISGSEVLTEHWWGIRFECNHGI